MTQVIPVPLWLLIILLVLGFFAITEWLLLPSVRWVLRQRVNKAIEDINTKLRFKLRPIQLTKRQVLIDRIIYDPQVLETLTAYAKEHDMPYQVAQERVTTYAREIVPAFNAYLYYRFFNWIARRITTWFYQVRVGVLDPDQYESVDRKSTVVFVMNHRSNIDYLVVSYLASAHTTLSYAVGEWARVWPLKPLIQGLGAYFVRRNSNRPLYRKVLERYINMATREGVSQAVFPEGGLTKSGLLASPKLGVLDYMLREFDHTAHRDVVFVPIGVNYDRVLEDHIQTRAQSEHPIKKSGRQWLKFGLTFLWRHFRMGQKQRWLHYGYAGVNFGKWVSAKSFAEEQKINFCKLDREQRFHHVGKFAEQIIAAISDVIPLLPVPLIALVFQEEDYTPCSKPELKVMLDSIIIRLQNAGAPIKQSEIPKSNTIDRALEQLLMHKLLSLDNDRYVCSENKRALLEYYANSLRHWLPLQTTAS